MRVAKEVGLGAVFLGAFREEGLRSNDTWDEVEILRCGRYYPMLNGGGVFSYLKGVFHYNIDAYSKLKNIKPDIVHVSDIEASPAGLLYKLLYRVKVIYNIHDNFAQRYPFPWFINSFLNILEGCIVKISDITLVPEEFRAQSLPAFCRSKILVVKNTPIDPGYCPALIEEKTERVKILFAGWLDWGRGVETLKKLAEKLKNIEVIVAGEGEEKIAEMFRGGIRCKYLGFVDHNRILDLTRDSHFVFAHYDPKRTINRYAAPNKLAEALAIGRPVIINSEVLLSKNIVLNSCGLVTEYNDLDSLCERIAECVEDRNGYLDMCVRARTYYEQDYSWGMVQKIIYKVFRELLEGK